MNKTERNKYLRAHANEIATKAARVLGMDYAPKCIRITQRRGHGGHGEFSVPYWASRNTDYFTYYVVHEVCHSIPGTGGHNAKFHGCEQRALAAFGMRPHYELNGPYVDVLTDADTGSVRAQWLYHPVKKKHWELI